MTAFNFFFAWEADVANIIFLKIYTIYYSQNHYSFIIKKTLKITCVTIH